MLINEFRIEDILCLFEMDIANKFELHNNSIVVHLLDASTATIIIQKIA